MLKLLLEARMAIIIAFVGEERLKLRKAMRYWCVNGGCISDHAVKR